MVQFRKENFYFGATDELIGIARELRKNMTEAECALWNLLRRKQLSGYRFRRQHPILHFVVDFLCFRPQLIIELDGGVHLNPDQKEYDGNRTIELERLGFKVIRFKNQEVIETPEIVISKLEKLIKDHPVLKHPSLTFLDYPQKL